MTQMAYATNTYRQTETDSRLQYMRSVPLSPRTSDHLMAVEKWLWEAPCLPAAFLVGNEFLGIAPSVMEKLTHVQQCCEAVVHLRFVIEHQIETASQLKSEQHAMEVYAHELQRLLGSMFHFNDPFWEQYYARQFSGDLFFIILDAIHRCTFSQNKVAYQLLLQSLKWVLNGYYLPNLKIDFRKCEAFHNARKLVDSLDLPDYKAWLIGHLANVAFPKRDL